MSPSLVSNISNCNEPASNSFCGQWHGQRGPSVPVFFHDKTGLMAIPGTIIWSSIGLSLAVFAVCRPPKKQKVDPEKEVRHV